MNYLITGELCYFHKYNMKYVDNAGHYFSILCPKRNYTQKMSDC